MGGYEPDPIAWTTGDIPHPFEFQLFDDDWEHFEQHLTQAIARVPALETAGVRQMINGPESFTPDGNFILGAAPECANMFVGAGFNAFGIASAGGAGWALAEWAVHRRSAARPLGRRHPPLLGPPPRPRLGEGAHPRSLWQALHRGLPARGICERPPRASSRRSTSGSNPPAPCSARSSAGSAPTGSPRPARRAARRLLDGPPELVRPGRRRAPATSAKRSGIFDQSSFAKYEVTGPGAAAALNWIAANDIDKPAGRLTYTQTAQFARRHRMRPHHRAPRRRPFLHRHRHRLSHPRPRLDHGASPRRHRRHASPTSPKTSAPSR